MKSVTVRDLQKNIKSCLDDAQDERIVVTRHGRPAVVLVGVEGEDWETVMLENDPEFWRLIEERRRQPTIPLEELMAAKTRPRRAAPKKPKG